jgi:hypothetical protein
MKKYNKIYILEKNWDSYIEMSYYIPNQNPISSSFLNEDSYDAENYHGDVALEAETFLGGLNIIHGGEDLEDELDEDNSMDGDLYEDIEDDELDTENEDEEISASKLREDKMKTDEKDELRNKKKQKKRLASSNEEFAVSDAILKNEDPDFEYESSESGESSTTDEDYDDNDDESSSESDSDGDVNDVKTSEFNSEKKGGASGKKSKKHYGKATKHKKGKDDDDKISPIKKKGGDDIDDLSSEYLTFDYNNGEEDKRNEDSEIVYQDNGIDSAFFKNNTVTGSSEELAEDSKPSVEQSPEQSPETEKSNEQIELLTSSDLFTEQKQPEQPSEKPDVEQSNDQSPSLELLTSSDSFAEQSSEKPTEQLTEQLNEIKLDSEFFISNTENSPSSSDPDVKEKEDNVLVTPLINNQEEPKSEFIEDNKAPGFSQLASKFENLTEF